MGEELSALRTPCNYIVALEALVGIGHQWSHVFLAYYIFSGINVVPFRTCFFMMIVSFICAKLSYCLFIVLAIDRLYIILWPSKYRTMNKGLYIFTLVFFANIFGVSMAIMSYIEMEPNYNSPVICYLPSVTGPTASRFTYIFQNSICGIGVALNVFFWLIMRFKRVISDKEAIKKVTRTITVYCALVLIFFQSASLVIMSMQYIVLPPVEKNVISLYAAIFINMLVCSNYFVYFAMSVDFRNEFKRQLYCIAAVMPGIKNVVPSPPTSIIKVTATRKTTVMF
uniref:G-protein coupled receptors family 1 profile domain-containing protein n=1 Tax=Panagrolaimus sp. PS1159 TaxID=55785 RepID=A0AC35GUB7_9BILA